MHHLKTASCLIQFECGNYEELFNVMLLQQIDALKYNVSRIFSVYKLKITIILLKPTLGTLKK